MSRANSAREAKAAAARKEAAAKVAAVREGTAPPDVRSLQGSGVDAGDGLAAFLQRVAPSIAQQLNANQTDSDFTTTAATGQGEGGGGGSGERTAAGWKEAGNEAFKRGEYEVAVLHYGTGLKAASHEALKSRQLDMGIRLTLHSNRAEALLRLQRWAAAKGDAQEALRLDSSHEKSQLRLSKAEAGLTAHGGGGGPPPNQCRQGRRGVGSASLSLALCLCLAEFRVVD